MDGPFFGVLRVAALAAFACGCGAFLFAVAAYLHVVIRRGRVKGIGRATVGLLLGVVTMIFLGLMMASSSRMDPLSGDGMWDLDVLSGQDRMRAVVPVTPAVGGEPRGDVLGGVLLHPVLAVAGGHRLRGPAAVRAGDVRRLEPDQRFGAVAQVAVTG